MSLNIAHINVRSLTANFNQFQDCILNSNYHIIGVSESWLHAGISSDVVSMNDYIFVRQDRLVRGGGVGIYLKNTIKHTILLSESYDYIEIILVKVLLENQSLVIANIYRPPNSDHNSFLNYFEDTFSNIFVNYENIVCLGDFNINLLNLDTNLSTQFKNVYQTFNFVQLITEPTRITNTTTALLDLILVNFENTCGAGVVDAQISDHFLVHCTIMFNITEGPERIFKYRALKHINFENFQSDLESIPWNNIYHINNIDDKIGFVTDNILQLFNTHAPMKSIKCSKRSYAPWITDNIKFMQKLRNKALTKFKQTGQNGHWSYYKQLRNLTNTAINAEKRAYLRYKFSNCNVKEKWSELKKLSICKNRNIKIPEQLNNVDTINDFFINSSNNNETPKDELINFYNTNIKEGIDGLFSFKLICDLDVIKIIQNIKSKAYGYDELNITLIHLCCPYITPFLTHIFNECIRRNYFPKTWKRALIFPLPKVNQPNQLSHLRSISVLPVLSKIFEKILELQVREFLNINNILPLKQSGFRSGFSCATALADVTDDIIGAIDNNKISVLVLLDYTKAFDMINHQLLFSILHFCGFEQNSANLILSFLSDRIQQTVLNNDISQPLAVLSGVPQGSILGPLLFTIFTSHFHKSLQFCNYHLYADDTQLYCSFHIEDLHEYGNLINIDLKNLVSTSTDHLLKINPSKSSAIIFCNDNIREFVTREINIQIGNDIIAFNHNSKSLGLIIDHKLRFKQHITSKLRLAYAALKMIYSQRHFLSIDIKKMLCDSLVLSHFNHCDTVYGPCIDSIEIRRIQKVQNSCLRLIFGIQRRQRISHKLQTAGWLNMYNRRKLHMACFFHKILKFKSPPYLLNKLSFRNDVHNINIRRKHILTVPQHRKEIFKRSFSYNIATCINKLPFDGLILTCESFKKTYKKYLMRNQ